MREHVMHIESDENAVYMLSSDENVLNIHLEQSVSANCAICHPKSAIHAWQHVEQKLLLISPLNPHQNHISSMIKFI